jgi:uncharacterized protein YecE (DUF72 family)
MNFGDLPIKEFNKLKFPLPPEPVENAKLLTGKPARNPKIYIGCGKWARKEWIGNLYPAGTKARDFLPAYISNFNSVELNATHYKLYKPAQLKQWSAKSAGIDFKFCPKVYKGISHYGNLLSKQALTDSFLESLTAFGKQLGPVFLQVSDKFSPARQDELYEFIGDLPRDLIFFVELRHPGWFVEPVATNLFKTLKQLKTGLVITDAVGRRDCCHMHLTTRTAFVRFAGNELHKTDYQRIDDWVNRITYWFGNGLKELYFFMHMHDEKFTPRLSAYLVEKLNSLTNFQLPVPAVKLKRGS